MVAVPPGCLADRVIVTHGKARLAVEEHGSGRPVLLVHAGVTDRRSWRSLVIRLGEKIRSISYDARGFGETTYGYRTFRPHIVSVAWRAVDEYAQEPNCQVCSIEIRPQRADVPPDDNGLMRNRVANEVAGREWPVQWKAGTKGRKNPGNGCRKTRHCRSGGEPFGGALSVSVRGRSTKQLRRTVVGLCDAWHVMPDGTIDRTGGGEQEPCGPIGVGRFEGSTRAQHD